MEINLNNHLNLNISQKTRFNSKDTDNNLIKLKKNHIEYNENKEIKKNNNDNDNNDDDNIINDNNLYGFVYNTDEDQDQNTLLSQNNNLKNNLKLLSNPYKISSEPLLSSKKFLSPSKKLSASAIKKVKIYTNTLIYL